MFCLFGSSSSFSDFLLVFGFIS